MAFHSSVDNWLYVRGLLITTQLNYKCNSSKLLFHSSWGDSQINTLSYTSFLPFNILKTSSCPQYPFQYAITSREIAICKYFDTGDILLFTDCTYNWCPPLGWNSGLPVVYLSLDSDENIQLQNGAEIIDGKVCSVD